MAIDLVADDMTRNGIEFLTELDPDAEEKIHRTATSMGIWSQINENIKWGRLYGGSIAVALLDGQDMRTPLRLDSVGPGQFKGLLVLDRWMVEPTLEDLVTEFGPHLGLPKFYRVQANAPALRGVAVHHSRVMFRHTGVDVPYQQRLMENLWGVSVIERLYDRMVAFDSASTGAAQLVYKTHLRTLSVKGLREVVAMGGAAMAGLTQYVNTMRQFQGIEGITVIDGEDKFELQGTQAFSGLSDALSQFAQQLSGALQIPLVRLFGQSPGGLGSNGDFEMRQYYDGVKQQQMKTLHSGVTNVYKLLAVSNGIALPPNFAIEFRSLWELNDSDKASVAKTVAETVGAAFGDGLISAQTTLKELRQISRRTGIFTNITREKIDEADDEVAPPPGEGGEPGMPGEEGGLPLPGEAGMKLPGMEKRPNAESPNPNMGQGLPRRTAGEVEKVDEGEGGGRALPNAAAAPRAAGGLDREGDGA